MLVCMREEWAMSRGSNLRAAKAAKNDEFYTQLSDIEKEMAHYKEHFKGKIVYCNCDDPAWSSFWRYFHLHFDDLGLKKLISTHISVDRNAYKLEYTGGDDEDITAGVRTDLVQNGDFGSAECLETLRECDIVASNPPFSLFLAFMAKLMEYRKKFLIIGSMNVITCKDIFPLFQENRIWLGCHSPKAFYTPDGSLRKFGNILWFTNLDHAKQHEPLVLTRSYAGEPWRYARYENYDAINVEKTADIPYDYEGVMGVPISFLRLYCPEQFEILGMTAKAGTMDTPVRLGAQFMRAYRAQGGTLHYSENMYGVYYYDACGKVKVPYGRILIRRKNGRKDNE